MRKEKNKKAVLKMGLSIRLQLIIGFLIPIVFIIMVGRVSYIKAYEGLTQNYEKSACTAMEMTMNSMDASMQTVSSITMELAQDKTVNAYALGGYDSDVSKQEQAKTTISNNMNVKETSSKMISGIHIIPVESDKVLTTQNMGTGEKDSFIDEMAGSTDAWMFTDSYLHWGSGHAFVDEQMGISTNEYILHCSQAFASGSKRGIVIVDVGLASLNELLQQLDFGEGSQVFFVSHEGRSIGTGENTQMLEIGDAESGSYVRLDGKSYFYMSADSKVTGGKIVALVPKAYITAGTTDIKNITVALVVVACVVALLLGTVIISGISKNIKKSVKRLDAVSRGELFQTDGKECEVHNEFGKLHTALFQTVGKIRELILTVAGTKDEVMDSGEKVILTGSTLNKMVENVSEQMEEINHIVGEQNQEIFGCNEQMELLSGQIQNVSGSIFDTMEKMEDSREKIDGGMQTVEKMVQQSKDTKEATGEVQEHVTRLAEKLEKISTFVDNIQDIAEQTNLLSLNASIEAARAGEHGKGFSIVAQEIRKLADNSGQTAEEIHKIIDEVAVYSENALKKVEVAGTLSMTQVQSAQQTIDVFLVMNSLMDNLLLNMKKVSEDVEEMNQRRYEVLGEVRAIGESSENTVKSTKEVNRFLEHQMESAVILQEETMKMKKNMIKLQDAILTFKL